MGIYGLIYPRGAKPVRDVTSDLQTELLIERQSHFHIHKAL